MYNEELQLIMVRFELQPSNKGKYLLDSVCQQLNLIETDYFGLRYVDAANQRVNIYLILT